MAYSSAKAKGFASEAYNKSVAEIRCREFAATYNQGLFYR